MLTSLTVPWRRNTDPMARNGPVTRPASTFLSAVRNASAKLNCGESSVPDTGTVT